MKIPYLSIFFVFISLTTVLTQNNSGPVSILAVGDVMTGGSMASWVNDSGVNYPFANTRSLIRQADIAICNLEAPYGVKGKAFKKKFVFLVPPRLAAGIKNAGFDAVALANNHMMDYGPEPLKVTLALLDSLGIAHSGAGMNLADARKPAVVERRGIKIAFLSYSRVHPVQFWASTKKPGTAPAYENQIKEDIKRSQELADIVVVSFHWGAELMETPKQYQKDLAHLCIDNGADMVLGHHPHILQGLELYQGKLIAYSLGNFAFGSRSRKCTESVILKTNFDSTGLKRIELMPLCVDNNKVFFKPTPLSGPEGFAVLENLARLSKDLGFVFEPTDSTAVAEF
ncbi:CapA family protein [candidate division TA06 bacterium]|uniref:CapA family protein n=1 Tax=candidate division TA06 bacterium TaxID=2250710 RepID=A0A933IA70_UNCT6|nr:CapA family protein [candidate division TA06 bacterium]